MHWQHDIPLSSLTTMRLGGPAQRVASIESVHDLEEVVAGCQKDGCPFVVLGGGSNIIARDEPYAGVVLLNRIKGFEVARDDETSTTIKVGAGEMWDDVVARTADMNLSGIEALSAIPGTAGATPVQNVGAYGQEIAETLVELDALDTQRLQRVTLSNKACGFSYRHSIFKDPAHRRHIITSVTLKLRKSPMRPPFYAALQGYLEQNRIADYAPAQIRQGVIALRKQKLPDPSRIANCGSFFKNPIVDAETAQGLIAQYPNMPRYTAPSDNVKLAAGWLMEQAGLKGHSNHGFATSPDNALVVINQSGKTFADLNRFKDELVQKVLLQFGVHLEQEPEIL